jgi:hypothetical protein
MRGEVTLDDEVGKRTLKDEGCERAGSADRPIESFRERSGTTSKPMRSGAKSVLPKVP